MKGKSGEKSRERPLGAEDKQTSKVMPDDDLPQPTAEGIPAADFRTDTTDDLTTTTRTYPVKLSDQDRGDFVVQVRANTLYRCRRLLSKIKEARFPINDLLLAVSMLCVGASVSAWQSGVVRCTRQFERDSVLYSDPYNRDRDARGLLFQTEYFD